MRLISRTNHLSWIAKRNISIGVHPDLQVNHTTNFQEVHNPHPNDTNADNTKNLSVARFVKETASQIPNFSEIKNKSRIENLITTQNQIGNESNIRHFLQEKDYKSLLSFAETLVISREYDELIEGVTREELTVFFKTLVEGQHAELESHNQLKFIVPLPTYKQLIEQSKKNTNIISRLYSGLLEEDFKFTHYELELLLTVEVNNYKTNQAQHLIQVIESSGGSKTINFWNSKLKVLGDADPGNWYITSSYYPLSQRGLVGGFERKVQYGNILMDLSEETGVIPNLETHRLIILGSGKNKNLKLIRDHIKKFWGISSPNDPSGSTAKVPLKSPIYPDIQLLEVLVAAFGVNNNLFEVLHYITEFQIHYNLDLSKAHHFWKLFIQWTEMTNSEDPENAAQVFETIWALMKSNNVSFNPSLYHKRSRHLVNQNKLEELMIDIDETMSHIKRSYDMVLMKRLQTLLNHLYTGCCKVVFQSGTEEEFDLKEYAETIAVNESHLETLKEGYETELEAALLSRERFAQLQKEYDEQDEEDSLW